MRNYHQLALSLMAHNGSQFLTSDRVRRNLDKLVQQGDSLDAKMTFFGECAKLYQSGWWYGSDMLPFGISSREACLLGNGFQLMAPNESSHKSQQQSNR